MLETQYRMFVMQWHVLRGAITALRNHEEGMTTLEVLVIAAGLVTVGGLVVGILTTSANHEAAKLP
jgi:hypothetical protein